MKIDVDISDLKELEETVRENKDEINKAFS